jgi:hypothetical protein
MKMFFGIFFFFLIYSIPSLRAQPRESLKDSVKISYFLMGRIHETELQDGIPYLVTVLAFNPNLLEQMIRIQVIDSAKFELVFQLGKEEDKREYRTPGTFGEILTTRGYSLIISKSNIITPEVYNAIKQMNYSFQLHLKQ